MTQILYVQREILRDRDSVCPEGDTSLQRFCMSRVRYFVTEILYVQREILRDRDSVCPE